MPLSTNSFTHNYPFDPAYGVQLSDLLQIEAPVPDRDFKSFWENKFERAMQVSPLPRISDTGKIKNEHRVFDIEYTSTNHMTIGGWLLLPEDNPVTSGLVVGHGYGGRDSPDFHLPVSNAALLFPCFRGLSRSRKHLISSNPNHHVLHNIDNPERYILGGCTEDLWLGVSALQTLFPQTKGHTGYSGISFGGGVGVLALPWDHRIKRAHLNVPSFGHQTLRLELLTSGSGQAVQNYQREHRNVIETLKYYDAAIAAQFVNVPVHIAAALFDPVVAPPGQFAIYNALRGHRELFVLEAGHFEYPNKKNQEESLMLELRAFFADL